MKCPVCKNECSTGETACGVCGFTELNVEFLNVEEAENWHRHVVAPCKAIWENARKRDYRKLGDFEIVGSTLIKYNYDHLRCPSVIAVPHGITTISSWAFNKVQTGYVILPNTVTQLEKYAFGNSRIEHLFIPNSVKHIGMHALGNREGTNVYFDFSGPNSNWGEEYGFNFPCEWGSPFYDWKAFERHVENSDFSSRYDYVRCYWKNEWVDILRGKPDQVLCLPSKKELVMVEKSDITIVFNGYSLGEGITILDEDGEETDTNGLYIGLLVNNRSNQSITINELSFDGLALKCQEDTILIEPHSFKEYCLQFVAVDENDSDELLALDAAFPETSGLGFSFALSGIDGRHQYDYNLSRLISVNAPGKGLNYEDFKNAVNQDYSI